MHVIFSQFSGLIGLFVFLSHVWRYASLEQAVLTSAASAGAIYLLLLLGDVLVRRILAYQTPALANGRSGAAVRESKNGSVSPAPPAEPMIRREAESVAAA